MGAEKEITDANFEAEVLQSPTPVLVDFWAPWCGPCKMLGPIVEKVAEANQGKVIVGKMNVDDNKETAPKYGIQGIPTLILFKGGEPVKQLVGYQAQEKIQAAIDESL